MNCIYCVSLFITCSKAKYIMVSFLQIEQHVLLHGLLKLKKKIIIGFNF